MSQEHYYQVKVQWKEGRIGELSSPILNNTIECAAPPEFPNGVPGIWSPEHLYAAAINSCFMATFLAIAYNFKLAITKFECTTNIKLEMVDNKYMITKADIHPVVELANTVEDGEKVLRVLEKAKNGCLVTNSMKTEVTMVLNNL